MRKPCSIPSGVTTPRFCEADVVHARARGGDELSGQIAIDLEMEVRTGRERRER